jgi:hypothetical protein
MDLTKHAIRKERRMENVKKRENEVQLRAETLFRLCMFYESLKLQAKLEAQINTTPHCGLHLSDCYLFIGVDTWYVFCCNKPWDQHMLWKRMQDDMGTLCNSTCLLE